MLCIKEIILLVLKTGAIVSSGFLYCTVAF
jgi:hypothetical protein